MSLNVFWPIMLLMLIHSGCTVIRPLATKELDNDDFIEKPAQISDAEVLPVTASKPVENAFTILAQPEALKKYCHTIDERFEKYNWQTGDCQTIAWNHVRDSVNGMPLIWTILGTEEEIKNPATEVTMLMCGVHGDEITPIQFCFDAIYYFRARPELFQGRVLVIAPIVNPDSFFTRVPSRTNARGVDINRNFPTQDWHAKAHRYWRDRYRSDKRRHPGAKPFSEPEVVFQVNLIKRYRPDKIISVHAPLTLLDLDGPEIVTDQDNTSIGHVANELLIQMSQKAKGYKVKNYPFFPGSLGNWAGNEQGIPTYTLELPDSDPSNAKKFWDMFREAMHSAVTHPFKLVQKSLEVENISESERVE